jgi:electron transfer flavoprotein alpha subunit
MAVKISTEKCIGCESCLGACPFGALTTENGKAVVNEACTTCGACLEVCPVNAIERPPSEAFAPMDKSEYSGIWVYIEQVDGQAKNVGHELLGQACILAETLQQEVAAVIIGDEVAHLAAEAFASGARKVYLVEGEEYRRYTTDAYTSAFTDLIEYYKPAVVLLGATTDGRDLGPRIACRLGTGLTADCTDLSIDGTTGLVAWTRPAFGGNIMATILCPDHRPQMGTVRPAVFKRPVQDPSRSGEIIRFTGKIRPDTVRTKVIEVIGMCGNTECKLEEAEIIVSGGRGMGNPENFKLIEELAAVLGGAIGASRAAVDAGWRPVMNQIGQTGKTVGPKIYFACGISGAVQHMAGISSSDIIIAINKDADAPIFQLADYGIVGDVVEVLPALVEEFKKIKQV